MTFYRMHVFGDLKPYICTSEACSDEMIKFSTRNAWAQHEFDEHRVIYRWKCTECDLELDDPETWRNHLRRDHKSSLSRPQLEVAVAGAMRCKDAPIEHEACPLCQQHSWKNRRDFTKHVCRHMEEIALLVIPRDPEDETEDMSEAESDDFEPFSGERDTSTKGGCTAC